MMDAVSILSGAVALIGVYILYKFFNDKANGYGPFTAGTLLCLVVLIFAALLCSMNKLEASVVQNIFFAVVGFAGGLFSDKKDRACENKKENKG